MGGFVIDTQDSLKEPAERFLPASYGDHITLTTRGVDFLLEHDPEFIPDISKEDIMDHSKSDWIAKSVRIIQVTWFCVNCVFRRAQELPLSLLEVYTLAHAICMIVVSMVWLRKPLNIRKPTVIRGEFAREISALLMDLSALKNDNSETGSRRKYLANDARRKYGLKHSDSPDSRPLLFVTPTASLPSAIPFSQKSESQIACIAIALLSGLYGGVHCIAWHNDFPSITERQLWHIAAIVVTASGTCFLLLCRLLAMFHPFEKLEAHWLQKVIGCVSGLLFVVVLMPLYGLASLFLLVESFRQLLYLPSQAYQLPSWSNYWPHFG